MFNLKSTKMSGNNQVAKPQPKQNELVTKVDVRFSYPHVFEKWAANAGDEPKYSIKLLIPKKETELITAIKTIIERVKSDGALNKKINFSKWRNPLRDADKEARDLAISKATEKKGDELTNAERDSVKPDYDKNPEMEGYYFINANSKFQPSVVDRRNRPISNKTEIYAGAWGRVCIAFFAYDGTKGVPGIGCEIIGIQKTRDDEPFGVVRTKAEDVFDCIPGEDEPEDLGF